MKNVVNLGTRGIVIAFLLVFFNLYSCKTIDTLQPTRQIVESDFDQNREDIRIEQAKSWFSNLSTSSSGRISSKDKFPKNPDWGQSFEMTFGGKKAVVVPFEIGNADIPRILHGKKKPKLTREDDPIGEDALSNLLIYRKDDQNVAEVVTMIPDEYFYKRKKKGETRNKFTGYVMVKSLDDEFIRGYKYIDGKTQGNIRLNNDDSKSPNGRPALWDVCDQVYWYTTACMGTICDTHLDRIENIYCWTNSGSSGGDPYLLVTGGGIFGNDGQGHYTVPGALSFPGINNDKVNVADIQCLLSNLNSNQTYKVTLYVDQPIYNSTFPYSLNDGVGHSFIGLEKTDPSTGVTTRRMVGFYPEDYNKGNISFFSPVDGAINYNEGSDYDISYSVPLTQSQFQAAVNSVVSWNYQDYGVDSYNCSSAAVGVFDAIGIGIPVGKTKIMVSTYNGNPTSNPGSSPSEAIFIISPGALGQKLRDLKASNPSFNINTGSSNMSAPFNSGSCN